MKTNDLAVRPIISGRESEKMIWAFIRHGNHNQVGAMRSASKARIETWFAENREPLPRLIAQCRSYFSAAVPFVENFVGSTWSVISEGPGEITASIYKDGKDEPEIQVVGSGTIGVDYHAKFESACRARDNAISGASLDDLHTSVIKGIASIESYVAHRVDIWNRSIAAQIPLNDTKDAKVSFDDKIKIWIPTMTNGAKLDIGGKTWDHFLFLL